MKKRIELDFGKFVLDAELFETTVAFKFAQHLPVQVPLTHWGNELYGSMGKNLGEENPVEDIPPGGIAYTNQGNYVCVFFGQRPAWAVEYIGQICGNQWEKLLADPVHAAVSIRVKA